MNPNNAAKHVSDNNTSNQFNPTTPEHKAVLDNRSRQIQENKDKE
jgi:hypothetical protein